VEPGFADKAKTMQPQQDAKPTNLDPRDGKPRSIMSAKRLRCNTLHKFIQINRVAIMYLLLQRDVIGVSQVRNQSADVTFPCGKWG
jgi:hypothetical protein